jgi:hypothetical protein
MDVNFIKAEIAMIVSEADGDPELAHCLESELYIEVLRAIAQGAPNAQELATEALKAKEIKFPRWFA